MADPCAAQLATANSCVSRDPATCSCFTQPFIESFPREVTGAYFYTIAFETPGTTEFCAEANFNVCTQFETTASCCCGEEITEYTECMFTSALNIQFGAPGCEHTSCSNDREEAALGDVMLIIIGIIVVVLGCGGAGGFFCYLRRKRLGAFAGKAMDTRECGETESSYSGYWGDRYTIESGRDQTKSNSKRGGFDSESESDSDCAEDNKKKVERGKLTKKSSEFESDDREDEFRGKKKKGKTSRLEQESSRKQITDLEIKKQEIQSAIRAENVQREVMEARLREAERTAIQLRSEQESSLKQITDLVIKQHEAEHRLQETQNEVKLVRSNSGLELTAREGEIIRVAAELEGVRSERKNIHKMIKNLEEAKQDMEGRLTQSKGGATVLKVQNEESTKRGSEVEKDRETMTHSLSCKHELKTKREQAIRNHSPCGKAEGE